MMFALQISQMFATQWIIEDLIWADIYEGKHLFWVKSEGVEKKILMQFYLTKKVISVLSN